MNNKELINNTEMALDVALLRQYIDISDLLISQKHRNNWFIQITEI